MGSLRSTFANFAPRLNILVTRWKRGVYRVSQRPTNGSIRDSRGPVVRRIENLGWRLGACYRPRHGGRPQDCPRRLGRSDGHELKVARRAPRLAVTGPAPARAGVSCHVEAPRVTCHSSSFLGRAHPSARLRAGTELNNSPATDLTMRALHCVAVQVASTECWQDGEHARNAWRTR